MELNKKYKSGSALEILQEAILFGNISAETSITQNELADALGISRMPVREALIALEYQGLIEKNTNQHINIAPINDNDIYAIFSDLTMIECEVLKNLSDEKISELASCENQKEFHKLICANTSTIFRRKILETLTGIYLTFVLSNSDSTEKIDTAFNNLRQAMALKFESVKICYEAYADALADALITIRRKKHA